MNRTRDFSCLTITHNSIVLKVNIIGATIIRRAVTSLGIATRWSIFTRLTITTRWSIFTHLAIATRWSITTFTGRNTTYNTGLLHAGRSVKVSIAQGT